MVIFTKLRTTHLCSSPDLFSLTLIINVAKKEDTHRLQLIDAAWSRARQARVQVLDGVYGRSIVFTWWCPGKSGKVTEQFLVFQALPSC